MHRGKWGRGPWGPTIQHGHGLPDGHAVCAVLVIPVSKSRFPAPPARFPWIHEDRRTDKDERKEEVSSLERRPRPLSLLLCGCVLFLFNKFSIRGLTRARGAQNLICADGTQFRAGGGRSEFRISFALGYWTAQADCNSESASGE